MQEGMSPGKQGINGWIFGLLTLDSLRYQVPEGAAETRESILISILEKQLADGGFSLNASTEEMCIRDRGCFCWENYIFNLIREDTMKKRKDKVWKRILAFSLACILVVPASVTSIFACLLYTSRCV